MPANVEFVRSELREILPVYELIRDVLGGQIAMKKKDYLPKLNATDTSAENIQRNKDYLDRAIFYNFTTRTVRGLVGAIFLRPPVVELPPELQPLIENVDGDGTTLDQLSKNICGYVLPYGRGGLLVDYPVRDTPATKMEIESGMVSPTISFYSPWDIINWRTSSEDSATSYLTLIVLRETYDEDDDGFETSVKNQYRVYRLMNGHVQVEVWRPGSLKQASFQNIKTHVYQTFVPTDGNGEPLTEIPFDFIGSENNDEEIDYPPIYDLSVINLGHYRNSADYEESAFMVGQPTPVVSGLTDDWVENHLDGRLYLGSRTVIPLPVNGRAELLEASQNTLAGEAMMHKEDQAKKLGAKLIEKRNVEKTATEAELDSGSENSVLTAVVNNVERAMQKALRRAAAFVNAGTEGIVFELNDNFDLTGLTAEEMRWLIELVNSETPLLVLEEARTILRRSGMATLTYDEYETQIVKDKDLKEELIIPEPVPAGSPMLGGDPPMDPPNDPPKEE